MTVPESLAVVSVLFFGLVTFLALTAVYLVIKAAVRQGTLEAHRRLDREREARVRGGHPPA